MADEKSAKIKLWQNKLLAAFSPNGSPGGQFLASSMAAEEKTGGEFMEKWYGHRVLTDSFMACCRFRGHRVRCHDGTGGVSWRGGSLHASSSLRRCG